MMFVMRMLLLVVSLATVLASGGSAAPQDLPDFSGKWMASIAKPTGREVLALGNTFTVTQVDTILQLEVPGSKRTLIIDGMAHEVRMPREAPVKSPARGGAAPLMPPARTVTTNRSMTTTSWQDGALRIVTVDTETVTQPTAPPTSTDTKKITTLIWRFLPDGLLSVERTIASESASGTRSAGATVKTVYARR